VYDNLHLNLRIGPSQAAVTTLYLHVPSSGPALPEPIITLIFGPVTILLLYPSPFSTVLYQLCSSHQPFSSPPTSLFTQQRLARCISYVIVSTSSTFEACIVVWPDITKTPCEIDDLATGLLDRVTGVAVSAAF
jgi:hypothetical protein